MERPGFLNAYFMLEKTYFCMSLINIIFKGSFNRNMLVYKNKQ